ncbi:hypothetical protein E4T43_07730 [Aureobasidium subglaciale]|nr:hypothetical protein E4T43_07730 [Aureobasidium subglaciale]
MHPDVNDYGLDPISTIVVGSVMFLLTGIALSLRVYVRGFLIKSFGWDDRLLCFAFFLYTGNCIILILMGATQAVDGIEESSAARQLAKNEIVPGKVTDWKQLSISGITVWNATEIFIKFSAALFFYRIVQETWQKRTILISITVYIAVMTTVIFLTIFQCGVPSNIFIHENCLDWDSVMGPISYFSGALTAATDWIFVLTTVSLVLKTRMPPRAKISVCLLLSLAALGSIVSIVRIPFIRGGRYQLNTAAKLPRVVILAAIEAGIGIIALSLATLRPLVKTWMDALSSKASSGSEDIERQVAACRGVPAVVVAGPSEHEEYEIIDIEMARPKDRRADSHWDGPVIATITMPSELSGRYGVLDSVYSADKHER